MTWNFHSGHGSRAAILVAAVVVSACFAPVAGAQASPMAQAWTVQPSPNPKGALASQLQAVSCPGLGSCVAVGSSSYPSGHQAPRQSRLVERLSGGVWTMGVALLE